jgi:hypothetical protein
LAAANSSPSSRHGGHSRPGAASQDGFGKLPAIVVGNKTLALAGIGKIQAFRIDVAPQPRLSENFAALRNRLGPDHDRHA